MPQQLDESLGNSRRKQEKVVLVYSGEDLIEKRGRPSKCAAFFDGTTLGAYLLKRKQEAEVLELLDTESSTLSVEDPDRLRELQELRETLRTEQLPRFHLKYHPDLLEEAAETVPWSSLVNQTKDPNDENFELSDLDRARLEAMFADMASAEGGPAGDDPGGVLVPASVASVGSYELEMERTSMTGDGEEVNEEGEENYDNAAEEGLEHDEIAEEEHGEENRSEHGDEDEAYSDTGSICLEAEGDYPKQRGGHFSRWEKDPSRALQGKGKEKTFKPRLNGIWQQRLEKSKRKKEEKVVPAQPKPSLFNSILPERYRRKTKSRLPSISHHPVRRDKLEVPVEISKPRQNRSSELRMKKRLVQESPVKALPVSRRQRSESRRLRRSQSQRNVSHAPEESMRRSRSMRALPSTAYPKTGKHQKHSSPAPSSVVVSDRDGDDDEEEEEIRSPTRRGTPHPDHVSKSPDAEEDNGEDDGVDTNTYDVISINDEADDSASVPPVSV